MNIFIGILLLCALLGLWDKISGGKMGLAAEFDGGLASMASLALSIVGTVSYTHLDVYKRQIFYWGSCFCGLHCFCWSGRTETGRSDGWWAGTRQWEIWN